MTDAIILDLLKPMDVAGRVVTAVRFDPLTTDGALEILDAAGDADAVVRAVARHGVLLDADGAELDMHLSDVLDELPGAHFGDLYDIAIALTGTDNENIGADHVEETPAGTWFYTLAHPVRLGKDQPTVTAVEVRPGTYGQMRDVWRATTLRDRFYALLRAVGTAIMDNGETEPMTDAITRAMRAEDVAGIVTQVIPRFFDSGRRWRRA